MYNRADIPLPLAAWLAHDSYDHVKVPNYFSATTLIQPIGLTILERRAFRAGLIPEADLSDRVVTHTGTAVHDSIEAFWRDPVRREKGMLALGVPPEYIAALQIDPTTPPPLNVPSMYMEQRSITDFMGYKIGGKYDTVFCRQLMDYKLTSVFNYSSHSRDLIYQMQGSIYKWQSPDIILEPTMKILFLFKDWRESDMKDGYPVAPAAYKEFTLLSSEEVEAFLASKLASWEQYRDAPLADIPPPNFDTLLRSKTTYKYFADPSKTFGRSTKNFDSLAEATAHCAAAKKGIVLPDTPESYESKKFKMLKELLCMQEQQG